jgi:hypothetical protein
VPSRSETLAAISVLLLAACGGSDASAPVFVPPPRAATAIAFTATASQRQVAPIDIDPIDPDAAAMLQKNWSLAPLGFNEKDPPKLTSIAVETTSRSEARGLSADGPIVFANLAEGQRASESIALVPGDCITVIAHGGLGVMEVDAFLLAQVDAGQSSAPPPILCQDARTGPIAIIGGQGGCFAYSGGVATHADLAVQARRGSGPVVMRVFRAGFGPVPSPRAASSR